MMTLESFKKICGVAKIELFKGKGRKFAETPVGNVFAAANLDMDSPIFVVRAGKGLYTKTGESLEGTYWLVNANVELTDVL